MPDQAYDTLIQRNFDEVFNRICTDEKVSFDRLLKELPYKQKKSTIAAKILSLLEQVFALTVARLVVPDIDKSLRIQGQPAKMTRAKSLINKNSSETLLQTMFDVIFEEMHRYTSILKQKPGIDWTVYAQ
jgi:hypothetical protein